MQELVLFNIWRQKSPNILHPQAGFRDFESNGILQFDLEQNTGHGLLFWLSPLEEHYYIFFFSNRVKNNSCKLLRWIIHCLIISLASNLSSIYLAYKSKPNISVISSYSVHPDRGYSVPFTIASPEVTGQFVIITKQFLKTLSHCWSRTFILHGWTSGSLLVCIKTHRVIFAAIHLPCYQDHSLSAICLLFCSSCSNFICHLQILSARILSSLSDHQQCPRV